ncbi:MAG: GGDEF domain-containing protein [Actinomycetota bacterium]|nr:GGDEF domain-containing protein [Actinomycetota bacterium]
MTHPSPAVTAGIRSSCCARTLPGVRRGLGIAHSGAPAGVRTISVGISSFVPGCPTDSEGMLRRADLALYQAKGTGRNRVTVADLVPVAPVLAPFRV